jgi:hypothetical protein
MIPPNALERRSFYRVHDIIGLRFQILEENEVPHSVEALQRRSSNLVHEFQHLHQIGNDFTKLLSQLKREEGHLVTQAITLCFEHQQVLVNLFIQSLEKQGFSFEKSNLSAGGISFDTEEELSVGDRLLMEMVLPNINAAVHCVSEVVDISDQKNGYSLIKAHFKIISEEHQDLVSKSVMRVQSKQLRKQRQD